MAKETNDQITGITYNGQPLNDAQRESLEHYHFELTNDNHTAAPMEGPYQLDIAPVESAIRLTFRSEAGEHAVELPIRDWKDRISERDNILDERYHATCKSTDARAEAYRDDRTKRHDTVARQLQEALAAQEVATDFSTARNLFACIAPLVAPTLQRIAPRDSGMQR